MTRPPIDAIRHVAQLLLIAEPNTASATDVRARWAEMLQQASAALEDAPAAAAADQALLALEAARAAVEQGVAALAGTLAQVGVATLIQAKDEYAWHSGLIDLPDGRKLHFEGSLEVME
jgi:myo-inositol catabolism protein IolC